MSSVNRVTLIGNLGRDPEVRTFQTGGKVCNFSLATSQRWKDKAGQQQERTEWHSIAIFNEGLVSVAERYLRKGSKVYIEGQLETRKWQDQSGNDRYSTEVVLRPFRGELKMLDGKREAREDDRRASEPAGGTGGGLDDSIPFIYEWRG